MAGQGQRGVAAEGMPRDRKGLQIETPLEWGPLFPVQLGNLIEDELDIRRPVEGVREIHRGRLNGLGPLGGRQIFPNAVITADMLRMNTHVPAPGPMTPEVFITVPGTAKSMGEDNDGERSRPGLGEINLHRHIANTRRIMPVQLLFGDVQGRFRWRVLQRFFRLETETERECKEGGWEGSQDGHGSWDGTGDGAVGEVEEPAIQSSNMPNDFVRGEGAERLPEKAVGKWNAPVRVTTPAAGRTAQIRPERLFYRR